MFKVNNKDTKTTPGVTDALHVPSRHLPAGVLIVNFEYISHLVLVFLLLTLNM